MLKNRVQRIRNKKDGSGTDNIVDIFSRERGVKKGRKKTRRAKLETILTISQMFEIAPTEIVSKDDEDGLHYLSEFCRTEVPRARNPCGNHKYPSISKLEKGGEHGFEASHESSTKYPLNNLDKLLSANSRETKNPYKLLNRYDTCDVHSYPGRRNLVETSIERINYLFDRNERGPNVMIRGKSGSGKSSFLRAGLLGNLSEQTGMSYLSIVASATDLTDEHGVPRDIAKTVLNLFKKQSCPKISTAEIDFACRSPRNASSQAIDLILRQSACVNGERLNSRIVLAIDQFEEIMPQLDTRKGREDWIELVSLIAEANKSENFCVFLTGISGYTSILKVIGTEKNGHGIL